MDEQTPDYHLNLSIDDVHLLYHCVCKRLKTWEGGNPMEQEHLFYMRDWLYRLILEYKFDNM